MMNPAQRRHFLWVILLMALILTVVLAQATTFSQLQFQDLANQATAIARVRCVQSKCLAERNQVWTDTTFEVLKQHKGILEGVVTVRTLGGTVGNLHSRPEGTSTFEPGEQAYLFIWKATGEPYRILGWRQGAFRIVHNRRTGAETVTQDSTAIPGFDLQTGEFRPETFRAMPVEDFQLKLRRALEGSANQ
jgi:hypothetical protein